MLPPQPIRKLNWRHTTRYDALSAALARRPPNAIVIIGADTNASIGRGNLISDNDNDIESLNVVGSFGIE